MNTAKEMESAILYSFRRCPYAIRARMALSYADLIVELREVNLREKPVDLLKLSPKATVPVLLVNDSKVIDESLDIMLWALSHADPDEWLYPDRDLLNRQQIELITKNDQDFKPLLDRYKYADRFPQESQLTYRNRAAPFLSELEERLQKHSYLMDNKARLVDIALFPFIRQFAFVDIDWFKESAYIKLCAWLYNFLESDLFKRIMIKQPVWKPQNKPVELART